jgi:hypothetical protein
VEISESACPARHNGTSRGFHDVGAAGVPASGAWTSSAGPAWAAGSRAALSEVAVHAASTVRGRGFCRRVCRERLGRRALEARRSRRPAAGHVNRSARPSQHREEPRRLGLSDRRRGPHPRDRNLGRKLEARPDLDDPVEVSSPPEGPGRRPGLQRSKPTRPRFTVNPATCSTKVRAAQPVLSAKNRRTRNRSVTARPPTPKCGNRNRRRSETHTDHDHAKHTSNTRNTRATSITKFEPEPSQGDFHLATDNHRWA